MVPLSSLFSNICRIRNRRTSFVPLCAGLKTVVERKLGLPPKPKRPSTSYCLFIRKALPEIRVQHPKLSQTDYFRIAGEQWRNVDPKVLNELEELAAKEKSKYSQAIEKYNSVVTIEDRAAIKEARENQKLLKERKALRKKLSELGMPKKPLNPFLLFVNDWIIKNPKIPQREAILKCAPIWKGLGDGEKAKWQAAFKKMDEEYQKKIKSWEADMIKQGKLEITYDAMLKKSFGSTDVKSSKDVIKPSKADVKSSKADVKSSKAEVKSSKAEVKFSKTN